MGRDEVVRALREIAVLLRIRGETEFKVRAYETAASRMAQVQGSLSDWVRRGALTQIPGIGKGIASRIEELVRTGRLGFLEELKAGLPPGILELMQVPGLGAKKASVLWNTLGIAHVDDLEHACREHKVRSVPGFGAKLEAKFLEGIEALRAAPPFVARARLGDALPTLEPFARDLGGRDWVNHAIVAGEARRACEEVATSELLVCTANAGEPKARWEKLPTVASVVDARADGATVKLFEHDLEVIVRCVREESWATALMYATGSAAHWQRLRDRAAERGLVLTEAGLFRVDQQLATTDEAAVYGLLGLEEIPPELREDAGEIEAAAAGKLPTLITDADIRGIVHSHSTWSDGANSLEEMARAAKALGLSYLTVTEHSPTASYAGGVKLDALERQWAEIDALNAKLEGFRLLKGVESDILPDGSLDYPDHVLEAMDVVIGSVHNRHQMDEAAMTRRILGALDNPHLHILGHATGRLLQRREPYAVDMDAVLDRAAERGVAIEVNGNPRRLDLKAEHVRAALTRGVRLVCSTDSHSVRELENVRYSVLTARRGWARKQDVLNTQDASSFVRALKAGRRS